MRGEPQDWSNKAKAGNAAGGEKRHDNSAVFWCTTLEGWICNLNIERFRAQIADTTDESQRAILLHLLGEHEAEFRRIAAATSDRPPGDATE